MNESLYDIQQQQQQQQQNIYKLLNTIINYITYWIVILNLLFERIL